jgi:hypothetical protein
MSGTRALHHRSAARIIISLQCWPVASLGNSQPTAYRYHRSSARFSANDYASMSS